MVYHRKDKDRVEKAAEILSRNHKKEEGEVKAEPYIAAIAIPASPEEEKASNSDTLSPKHDVVCVSLSPVKVEKKRKDRAPSPSSTKMIIVDLTAEEECETFLLTQLSEKEPVRELNEKESIVYEREMYRSRAWAAPATPAKAPISQDLSGIPPPFAQAAFEEKPEKKVGLRILCRRHDWLPVDHLHVAICSMFVESLLEAP